MCRGRREEVLKGRVVGGEGRVEERRGWVWEGLGCVGKGRG